MGWDVVKSVVHDQGIKNQSEVLKHMRHALTGRRVRPNSTKKNYEDDKVDVDTDGLVFW